MRNELKGSIDEYMDELSLLCGIVPEYYDIKGNLHRTSHDTKRAILSSMGIDIDSLDSLKRELRKRRLGPWLNIIEPVYVLSVNEKPLRIPLYIPIEDGREGVSVDISISEDNRDKREFRFVCKDIIEELSIDGKRYIRTEFVDNHDYTPGYYDVEIVLHHYDSNLDGLKRDSRLILSPDSAYLPDGLKKYLGLSVNLYSLRSKRNMGIGDFGDLETLIKWFSAMGGHLIGINPLHAITNKMPFGISPYSPLSRLYKNFIYLDMDRIGVEKDTGTVRRLRRSRLIDYEGVASLKLGMIKKSFERFLKEDYEKGSELDRDFKGYLNEEGRGLQLFATYMALSERFGSSDWQSWPEDYQRPDSETVRAFMKDSRRDILFYQYIQWLVERQESGICKVAREAGMPIGIYHDLAIGAIRGSADVWSNRSLYALDMDVGAPPDDFSPDGQNWGFPPIMPDKLRESGYEQFIQTIRKNMKYAGALRIDHALGIFRLFWIPKGMSPVDGAYVRYPHEDLLRIIALESVRNKTIIVAEDLGTIGENVRESLRRFRMLSYRLFYFERRYPDPDFLPPSDYPELALSAVTTHDLPTLYGYWIGRDIEERKRLGKYPDDEVWKREIEERKRDRSLIIEALKREGLLSVDLEVPDQMTEGLCLAIYRYLMKTPSKIVLISLDDMLGRLNQQNMPGITEGYPNWRQKIEVNIEDMIRMDSGPVKFIHSLVNTLTDYAEGGINSPVNGIPD